MVKANCDHSEAKDCPLDDKMRWCPACGAISADGKEWKASRLSGSLLPLVLKKESCDCDHSKAYKLADNSSASVGTIYWCPQCGAISIDGVWESPRLKETKPRILTVSQLIELLKKQPMHMPVHIECEGGCVQEGITGHPKLQGEPGAMLANRVVLRTTGCADT